MAEALSAADRSALAAERAALDDAMTRRFAPPERG
jgi:hypothetical protein